LDGETNDLSWKKASLICFSLLEVVQELDVPLVVRPLRWFICLLRHRSFYFVPCFPIFGCFGQFMVGTVSSTKSRFSLGKNKLFEQFNFVLFLHISKNLATS
jgi:hypothetical protein